MIIKLTVSVEKNVFQTKFDKMSSAKMIHFGCLIHKLLHFLYIVSSHEKVGIIKINVITDIIRRGLESDRP